MAPNPIRTPCNDPRRARTAPLPAPNRCTDTLTACPRLYDEADGRAEPRRARDGDGERVVAGRERIEVARVRITEAGRRTIAGG
jgi:hypothetical protein